jgi:hypothetical protein
MRSPLSILLSVALALVLTLTLATSGCGGDANRPAEVELPDVLDVIIRGGTIYDGSGGLARAADIGLVGEHIVAIGATQHSMSPTATRRGSRMCSSTACRCLQRASTPAQPRDRSFLAPYTGKRCQTVGV